MPTLVPVSAAPDAGPTLVPVTPRDKGPSLVPVSAPQGRPILSTKAASKSPGPPLGGVQSDARTRVRNLDEAVGNLPGSVAGLVTGLANTVRHPIDTAANVLNTAGGAVDSAIELTGAKPQLKSPGAKAQYDKEKGAFHQFADPFTSLDKFGAAVRKDPVGMAVTLVPVAGVGGRVLEAGERAATGAKLGGIKGAARFAVNDDPFGAAKIAPKKPPLSLKALVPALLQSGSPEARNADKYADLQRRIVGRHKLDAARAAADLAKHQRTVGNASEAEQRALVHAVETRSQGGAMGLRGPMRQAADAIRKVALKYRERIEQIMDEGGDLPGFVQDYYVHLWKNPPGEVAEAMARIGKQGSGRNLKKRTLPTLEDGLEEGLIPVHENPLDAMTAYVDNMSRFLAAHELREEMIRSGLAKWEFEKGADPSRIKLNGGHTVIDAMMEPGKPGVNPEDAPPPKLIPRRILTASPEVAKRYNAFVDPGLAANLRRQGKTIPAALVTGANKVGGMVGNLALTGSGFHPALVAGKAVGSELAIGVNHLLRGRPVEAAKTLWYAPTAPVRAAYAGRQMGKRLLEGDHAMTEIDGLWRDAGNRFTNGSVYRASIRPNFLTSALRGTLKGDIRSALRATTRGSAGMRAAAVADLVPRALETFSAPVFEHYVPAIKRGVFEREMGAELAANPNWSAAEKRAAARRISDNIDGRMGELSSDNFFWSQTRTDALRLAFLSPSWVYGDVRLVLDAFRDAPKSITGLFQGKGLGHGTAAVVGIASSYFLMNGIANYLYTGERPKGEDWIAFRTGATQADGNPERAAVPSVMKDFFGAMRDPVGEAENKLHPLGRAIKEDATNQDWRGLPVYRPTNVEADDMDRVKNDIPENLQGSRVAAALKHLGGTVVPYGLQPNANGENSNIPWAAQVGLGLKPAGRQFTDPEGDAEDAKKRSLRLVGQEASAEAKAKARKEKP